MLLKVDQYYYKDHSVKVIVIANSVFLLFHITFNNRLYLVTSTTEVDEPCIENGCILP